MHNAGTLGYELVPDADLIKLTLDQLHAHI